MNSRSRLLAALVVAASVVTACSGAASVPPLSGVTSEIPPANPSVSASAQASASAEAPASAQASAPLTGLLAKIKSSGQFLCGTSQEPPLSQVDTSTSLATGALPDILNEFLRREGIDVKLTGTATPFASLIPALQSGRIQIICDSMFIRPERAAVIDFTETTFYNTGSLDVAKGNPENLHTLSDLCGKSAGTYEGSTYVDLLKTVSGQCPSGKSINIQLYPTLQNVISDLVAGRIDAGVFDASLSGYALKQNPSLNFELVPDYVASDRSTSNCAFGLAKGNQDFIAAFNSVYTGMVQDGTVGKIFAKWGLNPSAFFLQGVDGFQ